MSMEDSNVFLDETTGTVSMDNSSTAVASSTKHLQILIEYPDGVHIKYRYTRRIPRRSPHQVQIYSSSTRRSPHQVQVNEQFSSTQTKSTSSTDILFKYPDGVLIKYGYTRRVPRRSPHRNRYTQN